MDQYQRNTHFHIAIDSLAAMLPAMVDGLMFQCHKEQERLDELMLHLRMEPFGPIFYPPKKP